MTYDTPLVNCGQCALCSFWVERPKPSQAKSLVFQISNLPYTQRFTQNWPVLQLKYFGHLLISLDRFVSLSNITRLPKFCSILCQTIFFFVIVFVPFRKIAPVLIVSFFFAESKLYYTYYVGTFKSICKIKKNIGSHFPLDLEHSLIHFLQNNPGFRSFLKKLTL